MVSIIYLLGIINLIPQFCGRDDTDLFTSQLIQKSFISKKFRRFRFVKYFIRQIYILLHFANSLRLCSGKRYNPRKGGFAKILRLALNFIAIFYIFSILVPIYYYIFYVTRALTFICVFLIFNSDYFTKLIIITSACVVGVKAIARSFLKTEDIIARIIIHLQGQLNDKTQNFLKKLHPNDSEDTEGEMTIYLRINDSISESSSSSHKLVIGNGNDCKVLLSTGEAPGVAHGVRSNWPRFVINNSNLVLYNGNTSEEIKRMTLQEDRKWTFCLYANRLSRSERDRLQSNYKDEWKFCCKSNHSAFIPHHYSHPRNKSFTIDTSDRAQSEFRHLSFDANNNSLQMSWNCSLETDFHSSYTSDIHHKQMTSIEIDVPEMLRDIEHVIDQEILNLVKEMEGKLHDESYKIKILYRKTTKVLTITLPAINDNSFYPGCNSDLIPLLTQIGKYLRTWDFRAFSHHIKSSTVYYDVSSLDNIVGLGINKKLYDYIYYRYVPANYLLSGFFVTFGIAIIFFNIIYGEFSIQYQNDTSSSIVTATSQLPVLLAAIVGIIGLIATPRYDEKAIEEDIGEILFKSIRGYTLFYSPSSFEKKKDSSQIEGSQSYTIDIDHLHSNYQSIN